MNNEEHWLKQYWRPFMAWQYGIVCVFDFIIFPLFFSWFAWKTGTAYIQWDPITLKESGFYHMAMGAIIGVSAWTRGKEKIEIVSQLNSNNIETPLGDK